MEQEAFISGYCRQLDSSRTVTVETDGSTFAEADCLFETCCHAPSCPIAEKIREFLNEE